MSLYITRNFSWAEFECHDGSEMPDRVRPHIRALCTLVLEPLRSLWGQPLVVNSGWRSEAYNARVGGAKHSTHVTGEGCDFHPVRRGDVMAVYRILRDRLRMGELVAVGGVGIYPNWIHVDVRPRKSDGRLYVWRGRGVGSEVPLAQAA